MNGSARRIATTALALSMLALAGCATAGPDGGPGAAATVPAGTPRSAVSPSPRDAAALAQLAEVAPRTSTIDPALADWTECWLPGEHLIPADQAGDDTTWKVICRIHWHQKDGTARYQDTNCIGDFAKQPMLDHCYRWVHYDLEPRYEDHPGVRAGA